MVFFAISRHLCRPHSRQKPAGAFYKLGAELGKYNRTKHRKHSPFLLCPFVLFVSSLLFSSFSMPMVLISLPMVSILPTVHGFHSSRFLAISHNIDRTTSFRNTDTNRRRTLTFASDSLSILSKGHSIETRRERGFHCRVWRRSFCIETSSAITSVISWPRVESTQ